MNNLNELISNGIKEDIFVWDLEWLNYGVVLMGGFYVEWLWIIVYVKE